MRIGEAAIVDDVRPMGMSGTPVFALIPLLSPALADGSEKAQADGRLGKDQRAYPDMDMARGPAAAQDAKPFFTAQRG